MINKGLAATLIAISVLTVTACSTTYSNPTAQTPAEQTLTVGKVQREIRLGMSSAEVITILGSPNIVTTDSDRRETWVYDKISSETAYSQNSVGGSILIIGGMSSSGSKSTTQKTLTVIIKFDEQSKVRDFAYHTSKF